MKQEITGHPGAEPPQTGQSMHATIALICPRCYALQGFRSP